MRIGLVLLALAFVAAPAMAADIAKDPGVVIEGVPQDYYDQIDSQNPGAALIMSLLAEGVFTDGAPVIAAALEAAGESPVDIIYDPFDIPDLMGYASVWVLGNDCWWDGYWFAEYENALMDYMDAGGCVVVIGQDWLWQRGYITGFPQSHLGLDDAFQDANFGDVFLEYWGSVGGPLEGVVAGMMEPCWEANSFYTDVIFPAYMPLVTWVSALWGPDEGGCVSGTHYGALSAVNFECDLANVNLVVATLLADVCGISPVATQETSWGRVKGLFR
jgi:hypothetical protein